MSVDVTEMEELLKNSNDLRPREVPFVHTGRSFGKSYTETPNYALKLELQ